MCKQLAQWNKCLTVSYNSKCAKFVFGRGSSPKPAGELTTLPRLNSIQGWGRRNPVPHFPPQSTPTALRLTRSEHLPVRGSVKERER